jgi:hypothetical protein
MTKKKQVLFGLSAGIIIGIVCAILFLPKDIFNFVAQTSMDANGGPYIDEQVRLREYAEFGLTYDADTVTFFFDGQVVKKLDDDATYYSNDAIGTANVYVLRDSDGKIIDFNVK